MRKSLKIEAHLIYLQLKGGSITIEPRLGANENVAFDETRLLISVETIDESFGTYFFLSTSKL